jgi:chemotaxis protein CheD
MRLADVSHRREPPPQEERVHVYLHPGQVFASSSPCEVSTVLGSCVSVLLFDGLRRIGGASHYLLPFEGRGDGSTPRFGNVAIAQLLARMAELGSRKRDLVAKVFGGASVWAAPKGAGPTLGEKNVEVARRRLDHEGIPIVAQDVGGTGGRKLVFLTDEGHVWLKKL